MKSDGSEGVDDRLRHIPKPGPEVKSAQEQVQWAENRLMELAPLAVREAEWQIRYGTEKTRGDRLEKILDRVGLIGKTGSQTVVAPVIVINSAQVSHLPWAAKKKLVADGAVDEAQLVEVFDAEPKVK